MAGVQIQDGTWKEMMPERHTMYQMIKEGPCGLYYGSVDSGEHGGDVVDSLVGGGDIKNNGGEVALEGW